MTIVTVVVEVDLPADEGRPAAELQQGLLQPVHESLLDVAFGDAVVRPRKSKT